ncbi:MAG: ATP-dependent DNA helicase [Butyrivibrio sp.]|nr:ATP-dependent DNA helicase [Butyrivibrio sp.]
MQEGSRIHRMIQKSMGSEYHAEYPLRLNWDAGEYDLVIEGRADGVLDRGQGFSQGELYVDISAQSERQPAIIQALQGEELQDIDWNETCLIDEIKGTYRDIKKMSMPVGVHLSQAKCYAYIYAVQNNLDNIRVRMTYCNIDTEDIRHFYYHYSFKEISDWFIGLVKGYKKWSDFEFLWKKRRTESIKQTVFPFPYREGQKDLAAGVYRTIVHGRKLFLEAPTGTGKTITTVFPAIKAIGEGKADRLFYLTAKTITRTVAEDAVELLRQKSNLLFKTTTITARDKICFMEESNCNPDACPYAKGHYDRINDAMYDLLTHEDGFNREKIVEYATKHKVCPFEMSLDMSLFSDGIICDYNYVFDPFVYLKRFFAEGKKGDYLFLIDESHNLLDRGRDMYSASLYKESFLELKKTIQGSHPRIAAHLDKCNKEFLTLKRECDGCSILMSIDPLLNCLQRLSVIISEYLENHNEGPFREEILEFYFDLSRFLIIYEKVNEKYTMYSELQEDSRFMIKLFCVNPSDNLADCMNKGRSTILFSATLLPIQYYKKLLGGTDEDYELYAHSVFDPSKCGLFIGTDVTSRYSRRNMQEFENIASYIQNITQEKKGNYLVFFPSHSFLESVLEVYVDKYLDENETDLMVQGDYMSESAREEFLDRFSAGNTLNLSEVIHIDMEIVEEKNVLGFCVMGGIFSEGIDLKRDSLIGVIIVGTGIPQVCNEREILSSYFEEHGKDGFDYAYRFPGMNKVLQAAGRVIRTEDDIGVVALLDDRFTQGGYQSLFPREWNKINYISTKTVKNSVNSFWSSVKRE